MLYKVQYCDNVEQRDAFIFDIGGGMIRKLEYFVRSGRLDKQSIYKIDKGQVLENIERLCWFRHCTQGPSLVTYGSNYDIIHVQWHMSANVPELTGIARIMSNITNCYCDRSVETSDSAPHEISNFNGKLALNRNGNTTNYNSEKLLDAIQNHGVEPYQRDEICLFDSLFVLCSKLKFAD